MRLCVFSPDLEPLRSGRWRSAPAVNTHDATTILVTNSWADIPEGSDIHATGGARTLPMRAARRVVRGDAGAPLAAAGARLFSATLRDGVLEALRAADPDAIVSLDPAWTALIGRVIRSAGLPWPCVTASGAPPAPAPPWRIYDQAASVSIVLPIYNGITYLRQSIESCLRQTHGNLELIIVDDGSAGAVGAIVKEYSDARVRYVRHDRNRGLPEALNTGFRLARGDYRTWTSDDNYYEPDAVERMLSLLQTHRDVDFVYAECVTHDEDAGVNTYKPMTIRPVEWLAHNNYIGACFLYTRRVTAAIGEYNPQAVLAEDYDYWVRVSKRFRMQRLFRPLYHYRFHPSSLTGRFTPDQVAAQVKTIRQRQGRAGRAATWMGSLRASTSAPGARGGKG